MNRPEPLEIIRTFRFVLEACTGDDKPFPIGLTDLRWEGAHLVLTRGMFQNRPSLIEELSRAGGIAAIELHMLDEKRDIARAWSVSYSRILNRGPLMLNATEDAYVTDAVCLVDAELTELHPRAFPDRASDAEGDTEPPPPAPPSAGDFLVPASTADTFAWIAVDGRGRLLWSKEAAGIPSVGSFVHAGGDKLAEPIAPGTRLYEVLAVAPLTGGSLSLAYVQLTVHDHGEAPARAATQEDGEYVITVVPTDGDPPFTYRSDAVPVLGRTMLLRGMPFAIDAVELATVNGSLVAQVRATRVAAMPAESIDDLTPTPRP
jgi:hypothetical protein